MSTRLASLNQVKTFLRIPLAETGLDSVLGTLLEAVSNDCELYCGRTFAQQTVVDEAYDGGGEAFCVKNFPVDPDADFILKTTGFYTTIESGFYTTVNLLDTQFVVDYPSGIVSLQAGLKFPSTKNSIFASYTGGYAVTGDLAAPGATTKVNVPDTLSQAVCFLTASRFRFQQNSIDVDTLNKHEEYAHNKWAPFVRTA